jgi:hypothetical protein
MGRRRYGLSLWLYGRALGAIFAVAFGSLWAQFDGLVGERGILPATEQLERLRAVYGPLAPWQAPTLAFFGASDGALTAIALAGVACAVLLAIGLVPGPALLGCVVSYVSLVNAGGPFTRYQWDILLIEAGFASLLVTPLALRHRPHSIPEPPPLARWLLYALLVKLMFLSGFVKLKSGDPTWADLTALAYHYWTQALPNPLSYWAHHAPLGVHRAACLATFGIELFMPLLALVPLAPARRAAAASFAALMLAILATGNYGFFNLLALALCLPLLDDESVERLLPWARGTRAIDEKASKPGSVAALTRRLGGALGVCLTAVLVVAESAWAHGEHGLRIALGVSVALVSMGVALDAFQRRQKRVLRLARGGLEPKRSARFRPHWAALLPALRRRAIEALAVLFLLGSLLAGGARLFPELREFSRAALDDVGGLHLFNAYGLFAVMTTRRTEIVIEGSHDGESWRAYELPYKPGAVERRPPLLVGHMPRLDWQMWFAALGHVRQNPWLTRLMQRLLEGEPAVLALFEKDPFAGAPPRFVRAVAYDYRFSDLGDREGKWWVRGEPRLYAPVIRLPEPRSGQAVLTR